MLSGGTIAYAQIAAIDWISRNPLSRATRDAACGCTRFWGISWVPEGIYAMRRIARCAVPVAALILAAVAAVPIAAEGAASVAPGAFDTATAVKVISAYRASHGLPPVKLDPRLMTIAATHAQRMAAADNLDHVLPGEGSFPQRMNSGGYNAAVAAEDIGAGYKTLADVMTAWEKSPEHNANLLQPNVSDIGIAFYTTSSGIYNEYWSLVLARPAPPPGSEGPLAGGVRVGPFGFLSFSGD
jgi:uncharacterized protein YkwD